MSRLTLDVELNFACSVETTTLWPCCNWVAWVEALLWMLRNCCKYPETELLNGCYTIDAPGVYKLMAFYKDGNPHPPAAPAGAVHLSQELQSEEASFEIIRPRRVIM